MKKERPNLFQVSETTWFYYENRGLLVVHEVYDSRGLVKLQTDQFILPWRLVKQAMQSHENQKAPARKPRTRKAAKG